MQLDRNKTARRLVFLSLSLVLLFGVLGMLIGGRTFVLCAAILIGMPVGIDLLLKGKDSVPYKAWQELLSN